MYTLKLNNLNGLSVDVLLKAFQNVDNPQALRFKINADQGDYTDKNISYTFEEMIAIMSRIEELTQGIQENDSERDKFERIYIRITRLITYDYDKLEKEKQLIKQLEKKEISITDYYNEMMKLRHDIAGLYGGLVNGKSVCAGYALILHEAAQYVRAQVKVYCRISK